MTLTPIVLLFVIFASRCERGFSKDVFASSAHLKMLAIEEINLIEAIKFYISREKRKIQLLEQLISEVEFSRARFSENGFDYTSHPVDVFHLIHRFTTTWKADILPVLFDSTAEEDVETLLQSVESLIPEDEDYEGVMVSLIRIQHTYQLPIDHLIKGTVLNQKTKPMSQQMAVDVAAYALYRKLYDDSFDWLSHAWNHPIPPFVPIQDRCHIAAKAYALEDDMPKASEYAKYAHERGYDPENSRYSKISDLIEDGGLPWTVEDERDKRLCQKFLLDSYRRDTSSPEATCVWERGRVVPFMRRKVEYLNRSPDIVLFHDFVTDKEATKLIQLGSSRVKRAEVGYNQKGVVSEIRLGKTYFAYDDIDEPLIKKLSRRAMEYTGLETKDPSSEPLQLSNYGIGGHYGAHYDHYTARDNIPPADLKEYNKHWPDRIATLMIYLNNVEAGGATIFPKLNFGTRPVKNAAIFWYNMMRSGYTETKSRHSGCPVLMGEKWVANKWFLENGQEFRRPCELTVFQ